MVLCTLHLLHEALVTLKQPEIGTDLVVEMVEVEGLGPKVNEHTVGRFHLVCAPVSHLIMDIGGGKVKWASVLLVL